MITNLIESPLMNRCILGSLTDVALQHDCVVDGEARCRVHVSMSRVDIEASMNVAKRRAVKDYAEMIDASSKK